MKMAEMPVTQIAGKASIVYFGSSMAAPFHLLSNFSHLRDDETMIELNGILYCSTEHAYQSRKVAPDHRHRFSIHGDLSDFSIMVESDAFYPKLTKEERQRKVDYWQKKHNIGIIAKMAVTKDIMSKLGLASVEFIPSNEIWLTILKQKFSNERFKNVLLPATPIYNKTTNSFVKTTYTGKETLIEFSRSAKHLHAFFGGVVDENGNVYGENYMGARLMEVREELRAQCSCTCPSSMKMV